MANVTCLENCHSHPHLEQPPSRAVSVEAKRHCPLKAQRTGSIFSNKVFSTRICPFVRRNAITHSIGYGVHRETKEVMWLALLRWSYLGPQYPHGLIVPPGSRYSQAKTPSRPPRGNTQSPCRAQTNLGKTYLSGLTPPAALDRAPRSFLPSSSAALLCWDREGRSYSRTPRSPAAPRLGQVCI